MAQEVEQEGLLLPQHAEVLAEAVSLLLALDQDGMQILEQ